MSIDTHAESRKMVEQIKDQPGVADMLFLEDRGSRVIGRYGLRNPQGAKPGIPHPTVYVIDKQGIIRWKFTEINYKIRPTNEMIREALRGLR